MTLEEKTAALLHPWLEPDYFVIEVRFQNRRPTAKLQVILDGVAGIGIETCAEVSRKLSEVLEAEDWIEQNFVLEVSSPGTDRPLTDPRQYAQHLGRTLRIKLREGAEWEGVLQETSETGIVVVPLPTGKKPKTAPEAQALLYDQIDNAIVIVSFK
ncbi:MAG: ribosome maturation factor RimP [Microscillaceae bacterium]